VTKFNNTEEALASRNRAKMDHATFNSTSSSCGFSFSALNPANISPHVRAVLIARIVVNTLTCPLIIVLNILVIVAVKTKLQLRTKSNIALAYLSTTDLAVGLVVQLLHIPNASSLLRGDIMPCNITDLLSRITTFNCILASFHQLVFMSAERYIAIKHPFTHETRVTEARIILASGLAWAVAIILAYVGITPRAIMMASETLLIIVPIYFNVSVYKEVRRTEKQIAANQVSSEAKEKLPKKKKAFYTTVIVLLVILLCYIPSNICALVLTSFKERIPPNITVTTLFSFTLLPVLNSLFNPLIYAFKIRSFGVAFIQLLSRKTIPQAEELEKKIFGPRQIGFNGNVNRGEGDHN